MALGVGVRAFAQHLLRESVHPLEEERAVGCVGESHATGHLARRDHGPKRIDPLLEVRRDRHLVARRPCAGERVDFGHGTDHSGKLVVDHLGESDERALVGRAHDDEVVRRRAERRADHRILVANNPTPHLGVQVGMSVGGGKNPEGEVVASFVHQEQVARPLDERLRVLDPLDVHPASVRNRGEAAASRSRQAMLRCASAPSSSDT